MSAIVARFAALVRADPDRPLIHLPAVARRLQRSDVWNAHLDLCERLTSCALAPQMLVISAAGNNPAALPLLTACRACELAVMLVDAAATLHELTELATRFRAGGIVMATNLASHDLPHRSVSLSNELSILLRDEASPARYPNISVLKLTSGSTGLPNAVPVDDEQLIADSSNIVEAMDIRPDDVQIAAIPLSHAYGLSVLLLPALLQGTALVLRDSFVPHQLPSDAVTHRARIFPGVPYMFEYFIAHPPSVGWPSGLARLISAGARLAPGTVRRFHEMFGVKIHTFYGATETGGIAFDNGDDPLDNDTVGHPLPGVTVSLKHDDDAPPGAGRVHVGSSAVATGYLTQGGDGFSGGGFLTGDFGTFDTCGRLKLLGRASSFVNVAGRKVEPDEVERVLRSMPGIGDVRVVGAPDPQRGQQVVACVVATGGGDRLTAIDVRRFCSSRLAPHKIPRTVIFLDAIPITPRGKTDRAALASAVDAHLHQTS